MLVPDPVADCSTIAAWVKWNGGAIWQQVFDFGTDTTERLFLTPMANSGKMRFAITTTSNGGDGGSKRKRRAHRFVSVAFAITLDGKKDAVFEWRADQHQFQSYDSSVANLGEE